MDEEAKLLKIEKDIATGGAVVVCPNCKNIDICEKTELKAPYKTCDKCFYVFPYFLALTNAPPLSFTSKKFNFDEEKLNHYKELRTSELLAFHTYEDGTS